MSEFVDMIVDMLPLHSNLQKRDNQLRVVLDCTIGEYMDNLNPPFDELFLDSATGAWLDVHGADYGVPRKLDESDDDYRNRIVMEVLEHLTPSYLDSVYDLRLFSYVGGFSVRSNTLTSDNPYVEGLYMGIADDELKKIVDSKFITDNGIVWYTMGSIADYIKSTSDTDLLPQYMQVYGSTDVSMLFVRDTSIQKVRLTLPKAERFDNTFRECTGLTDVILNIPEGVGIPSLFRDCDSLVNLELHMPKITVMDTYWIRGSLSSLETVNVTVPASMKSTFVTQFSNTSNYPNISSLIVNGEVIIE